MKPKNGLSRTSETAQRIRRYIARHGLKPGDHLPTQNELMQQLKVGHRPLREGLSILKHQGFIDTRNKGGTIIRRPSFAAMSELIVWHLETDGYQMVDLISARAWLESGAAAEAAVKRTARDLLVTLDALEQLNAAAMARKNDVAEEEAFHLAIMKATHNPVILTFGRLVSFQFQDKQSQPEPLKYRLVANQEHQAIYEAIERRDSVHAHDLMYSHVMSQTQRCP